MKLFTTYISSEDLWLSYLEETSPEIADELLTELCGRAEDQFLKVVKRKFRKRPVPGTSPEDIARDILLVFIKHLQQRRVEHLRMSKEGKKQRLDNFLNYVTTIAFREYDRLVKAKRTQLDFRSDSYDDVDLSVHNTLVNISLSPEDEAAIKEAIEWIWPKAWRLPKDQFTAFFLMMKYDQKQEMASVVVDSGICKLPLIAKKMKKQDKELEDILNDRNRTAAEVGLFMGITTKEVYRLHERATANLKKHRSIFARLWNLGKR